MSDAKNVNNNIVDLDNVVEPSLDDLDLDELYNDAELENMSEMGDFDDVEEAPEPVSKSSGSGGSEKTWVILAILFFAIAVASSFVLQPTVLVQKQRVEHTADVLDKINLSNALGAQALTSEGLFDGFKKGVADTEVAVKQLTGAASASASIADILFGNAAVNQPVLDSWQKYQSSANDFVKNEAQVLEMKQMLQTLTNNISATVNESVGFVEAVAKEGRNKGTSTSKDKYLFLTSEASNLNGILGRLSTSMRGYFDTNSNLAQLSNRQGGLMVRLQDTLNRIVSNSAAVVATAAEPLQAQYADLESRVSAVGERASAMTDARAAYASLQQQGAILSQAVQAASNQSALVNLMRNLATLLPILFGLFGAFALWRYTKAQTRELVEHDADLEETLADQQESILKLLDEMSALADGDLTVEAEVTDQITGAIADSVNFAVMEMRELVTQINRASVEVANESELAVNNAQSVSQSNIAQSDQISQAAALMQRVTTGMREMSEQANSSSEMAAESIKAAEQGAQAVRDTIKGMDDMREQIQDTSKRIKRLGESSQRIGDIVALIDDIAEQTNILSLNAAIQASMAGEAGRGFAVVSDEVQSLAERSTEATKKIAELVTTIQNDTNDAVLSMEKATQQVVTGTKVADSAGSALSDIETVSQRLSGLVEAISKGSNEQAEVVTQVSQQVTQVSKASTDTSRKAQESANSIAKLLELAKDLETSVSRFKLPAS